eukprot:g16774.t1
MASHSRTFKSRLGASPKLNRKAVITCSRATAFENEIKSLLRKERLVHCRRSCLVNAKANSQGLYSGLKCRRYYTIL